MKEIIEKILEEWLTDQDDWDYEDRERLATEIIEALSEFKEKGEDDQRNV